MREIKFRAYCPIKKILLNSFTLANALNKPPADWHEGEDIIMQYTGLKDKNGKEIYEGDILEFIDSRGKYKGEVFFEKGKFQVMNFYQAAQDDPCDAFSEYADLEIIGNIYESKHLLYNTDTKV